jgi:hypothetical protein
VECEQDYGHGCLSLAGRRRRERTRTSVKPAR